MAQNVNEILQLFIVKALDIGCEFSYIDYVINEQPTLEKDIDMTNEIINSVTILLQLTGAIVVVLVLWAFFKGLYERHPLESVKEMIKEIPYILIGLAIFYCVICFIGMFLGQF